MGQSAVQLFVHRLLRIISATRERRVRMATIAPERAELGYALHENEGEAFWLLGMLQTIKIGRGDTGGAYGLVEVVVPEGLGSPWHVHPEEDEWFFILEGGMTVWVGDNRLSLKAGS